MGELDLGEIEAMWSGDPDLDLYPNISMLEWREQTRALIAHARDLRAEVGRLRRLLDTADQMRAEMQEEAGRQEVRADLAEAEIERLRLALAEHEDDGSDLTAHYREEAARMRAVVEAAREFVDPHEAESVGDHLNRLEAALDALDEDKEEVECG